MRTRLVKSLRNHVALKLCKWWMKFDQRFVRAQFQLLSFPFLLITDSLKTKNQKSQKQSAKPTLLQYWARTKIWRTRILWGMTLHSSIRGCYWIGFSGIRGKTKNWNWKRPEWRKSVSKCTKTFDCKVQLLQAKLLKYHKYRLSKASHPQRWVVLGYKFIIRYSIDFIKGRTWFWNTSSFYYEWNECYFPCIFVVFSLFKRVSIAWNSLPSTQ